MNKKIPVKVTPDSIVRAIFEIRFKLSIKEGELLGHLYPILIKHYPKLEQKNLGIPETIIRLDPTLKNITNVSFSSNDFRVAFGSSVINFETLGNYKSWSEFYSNIKRFLTEVEGLGRPIFERTERLGLRYINIINGGKAIDHVIDYRFNFNLDGLDERTVTLKKQFVSDKIIIVLNISENANLKELSTNLIRKGILIDIDVSTTEELPSVSPELLPIISKLHDNEKFVYFNVLKQDFIDSLNPIY